VKARRWRQPAELGRDSADVAGMRDPRGQRKRACQGLLDEGEHVRYNGKWASILKRERARFGPFARDSYANRLYRRNKDIGDVGTAPMPDQVDSHWELVGLCRTKGNVIERASE